MDIKIGSNNRSFVGIGVDVEDISRFSKINLDKNNPFLKKIYTPNELRYCLSKKFPSPHLAVRFCAKEAVSKALSMLLDGKALAFNKIEIRHQRLGTPIVKVKDNKFDKFEFSISLSHSRTVAMAAVVAWTIKQNNHV